MNKKSIYPNWFLIAPFLLYIIFFLIPALLGVVYSFTDWNVRSRGNISFIGLKNYIEIFKSNKNYASGILNTLKFTVISNVVKLIPALFLAILIQRGVRGHRIYQTIFYLPAVLPFLVIGLIFKSIFNYNNGLLNTLLSYMGLPSQKWLSDLSMVWKSIYGVDAWRGIGYCMTIFLAGLNGIPHSYYEAAEIDGAGFWRSFLHITLPMLTGAITINLVFGITYGLKVFDIVYVLTNGGPGHATEVMTTYSYQLYANGWYGLASSLNSILFVITTVIGVFVVQHMSRQEVQQ